MLRVPVIVDAQQTRLADTPAAAVELYTQVSMGIDTYANQALGEARLQRPHQAIGPFFGVAVAFAARLVGIAPTAVAPAMLVLALVEHAAVKQAPATVLDKALAQGLGGVSQCEGGKPCQRQGQQQAAHCPACSFFSCASKRVFARAGRLAGNSAGAASPTWTTITMPIARCGMHWIPYMPGTLKVCS
ncbi:hypothetical protein D3C81_1087630 [compost metagenome]